MSRKSKQTEKPVVTAEVAERMYAQAWPAKQRAVAGEIQAALKAIGARHNVTIAAQVNILPAFLETPIPTTPPAQGARVIPVEAPQQ